MRAGGVGGPGDLQACGASRVVANVDAHSVAPGAGVLVTAETGGYPERGGRGGETIVQDDKSSCGGRTDDANRVRFDTAVQKEAINRIGQIAGARITAEPALKLLWAGDIHGRIGHPALGNADKRRHRSRDCQDGCRCFPVDLDYIDADIQSHRGHS